MSESPSLAFALRWQSCGLKPMASNGFSKLNWLKRTDAHKLTGAEVRVLLSIFNHADGETGRNAHPGVELMSQETTYRKSGVSEAVASLKALGWIHETYRGNGKARLASVFDLIPDAPNPGYRCPEDRAGKCATCSNGSATAEVLEQPNVSGRAEVLDSNVSAQAEVLSPNDSGFRSNGSAVAGPMFPLERLPIDPGSDPKIRSSRSGPIGPPSDPGKFRYPPEHEGITETSSGLGHMPEDKTAELSPREDEPRSESEPGWESVSSFGIPDPFASQFSDAPPFASPPSGSSAQGAGDPRDPFSDNYDPEAAATWREQRATMN